MGELVQVFLDLFRGEESAVLKLAKLSAVVTFAIGMVIMLESAMGLVTIGRLERKVNLLQELSATTDAGIGSPDQLTHLFDEIVRDFDEYDPDLSHIVSRILPRNHQPSIEEILAGAGIWILMALMMLKTTKGGYLTKLSGSLVVVILGLGIGVFTDLIIAIQIDVVTLVLNFICGTLPLLMLGVFFVRRSRNQSERQNEETPDNAKA